MAFSFDKLNRPDGEFIAYMRHDPDKGNPKVCEVVFLGGFHSDMTGTKASFLQQWCRENQFFAVTTFDYYGHGSSSGNVCKGGTISRWLQDCLAVLDEIVLPSQLSLEATKRRPVILVGSSMGAWIMTLAAMKRTRDIDGLIGLAAAPDFTEDLIEKQMSEAQRQALESEGVFHRASEYEVGGFPITRELIDDGKLHLLLRNSIDLNLAVHLIHGTNDTDVPWDFSYKLMQAMTSQNARLSIIKGADHRLSTPTELVFLRQAIENMHIHISSSDR